MVPFSRRLAWDTPPNPLARLLDERRAAAAPILDLTLFRIPSFRDANVIALVFPVAFFLQFFGLLSYFRVVWHDSSLAASVHCTSFDLVIFTGAPWERVHSLKARQPVRASVMGSPASASLSLTFSKPPA